MCTKDTAYVPLNLWTALPSTFSSFFGSHTLQSHTLHPQTLLSQILRQKHCMTRNLASTNHASTNNASINLAWTKIASTNIATMNNSPSLPVNGLIAACHALNLSCLVHIYCTTSHKDNIHKYCACKYCIQKYGRYPEILHPYLLPMIRMTVATPSTCLVWPTYTTCSHAQNSSWLG